MLRRMTDIIAIAVMEDIDFNDVRQVRFETLCLENWTPYEARLKDNPEERSYVLYRYLSALHGLRSSHSDYISRVNWDAEAKKFIHPMGLMMEPEDDFRLFQRLAQGRRSHLGGESTRNEISKLHLTLDIFKAATGNPELAHRNNRGENSAS